MTQLSLRIRRSWASAPRTFAEAHIQGMEATSELRKHLGGRVRALIRMSHGDVDQVAVALGMLPWKVRQIVEGTADPTLGEIGRIAYACGETPESFITELSSAPTDIPEISRRRQSHRDVVRSGHRA